jgi:hypothetical protein
MALVGLLWLERAGKTHKKSQAQLFLSRCLESQLIYVLGTFGMLRKNRLFLHGRMNERLCGFFGGNKWGLLENTQGLWRLKGSMYLNRLAWHLNWADSLRTRLLVLNEFPERRQWVAMDFWCIVPAISRNQVAAKYNFTASTLQGYMPQLHVLWAVTYVLIALSLWKIITWTNWRCL